MLSVLNAAPTPSLRSIVQVKSVTKGAQVSTIPCETSYCAISVPTSGSGMGVGVDFGVAAAEAFSVGAGESEAEPDGLSPAQPASAINMHSNAHIISSAIPLFNISVSFPGH